MIVAINFSISTKKFQWLKATMKDAKKNYI